jgi:hypothetical protein
MRRHSKKEDEPNERNKAHGAAKSKYLTILGTDPDPYDETPDDEGNNQGDALEQKHLGLTVSQLRRFS